MLNGSQASVREGPFKEIGSLDNLGEWSKSLHRGQAASIPRFQSNYQTHDCRVSSLSLSLYEGDTVQGSGVFSGLKGTIVWLRHGVITTWGRVLESDPKLSILS